MFHRIRIQSELNLTEKKHTDPWSPKLAQAYLLVQYWKTIKHQKETNTDKSTRLENIMSKMTLEIQYAHDLKQIKEHLQNATTNSSTIRKNAKELRIENLWDRTNAAETEGNTLASKEIK